MELDPYVSLVTEQLVAAAALGDERTQQIAVALAASAAGAVRLATMSAISATADEINAALMDTGAAVTISVQLENDEPTIRVDAAPAPEPGPAADPGADGDASARISLRLPEPLKADIDAAAGREAITVNTWLVRAARAALNPARTAAGSDVRSGHHIRGWVTG